MASGVGLIPEQAWENARPRRARRSAPTRRSRRSASRTASRPARRRALTWSAGQFVRLMLDTRRGRRARPPATTRSTATSRTRRATTALTVTAPADRVDRSTSSVTVTGTSTPGNTIDGRGDEHRRGRPRRRSPRRHGRPGRRRSAIAVPLTGGTTVLNIVATEPDGRDRARGAHGRVRLAARHAACFDRRRPGRRRQRAGQLRLSDVGELHAGAYDLQRFQVYDAGDTVIFRVRTRDLTPTFGSPLGAQLVDVYVHDPGARRRPRPRRRSRSATTRSRRAARGAG